MGSENTKQILQTKVQISLSIEVGILESASSQSVSGGHSAHSRPLSNYYMISMWPKLQIHGYYFAIKNKDMKGPSEHIRGNFVS
jgi:hypothetical protein